MSKLSKLFDRFKATKYCILIERLGKARIFALEAVRQIKEFCKTTET